MGFDVPQTIQDDNGALAYLGAQAREAERLRSMEPLAREYQQYQGQFQAWRQQQAAQDAEKQKQAQQWWKAPEYDATWQAKLTRDPQTGELKVLPGAPPDTVQKYLAWADHQAKTMQALAQNPLEVIKPGLEQLIDQRAQQIVQQHLGGYQQQVGASQFIEANSTWLHARDANGNLVRDQQSGQPILSDLGQRFAGHVRTAAQRGLDHDMQKDYALACTQRDYALAQLQRTQATQGAVDAGDAAKAAFLAQQAGGRGPASPGAAGVAPGVNPPSNVPMRGKADLAARMMDNLKAAGFQAGAALPV